MSGIPLMLTPPTEPLHRGFEACGSDSAPHDAFEALLARMRDEFIPFTVLWEMTHTCNLDCIMCYNVKQSQPELATDEALELLEQMAQAGTLRLIMTGGEILARRDFFTIANRARALGFALDLKTNGSLLTSESADRMAALEPVQVEISLLGATTATFDAIAQSKDTLRRVLRGVKLLKERSVRVKLNTLLMDLNFAEREQMFEIASELGVEYEQAIKISQSDDGSDKAGSHQISRAQITDTLVTYEAPFAPIQLTPNRRTCKVGLSSCLISPYGIVYPCVELRIPAGDLRKRSFGEIWADAPIFSNLRANHTFKNLPECQVCPINTYCEGRCAGLAWKEHGDPYGGHMLACRHAQARFAQQNPDEAIPETPLQARLKRERGGEQETVKHQPIMLVDM